ncbi:MAG: HigA family addiction module antidote protein [Bacteroidetes bacterium]|nr:HigA family addiction module antidote protein [Bacteroidota bacterium]
MAEYKVIGTRGNEIHSKVILHPGEILNDELEARNLKKMDVAKSLGITPGNLSELVRGKRHVSAMTAIKLEKILGISAEYWLRVQMYYDLAVERKKMRLAA